MAILSFNQFCPFLALFLKLQWAGILSFCIKKFRNFPEFVLGLYDTLWNNRRHVLCMFIIFATPYWDKSLTALLDPWMCQAGCCLWLITGFLLNKVKASLLKVKGVTGPRKALTVSGSMSHASGGLWQISDE